MKTNSWVLTAVWLAVVLPVLALGQTQGPPVQASTQAPADDGIGVAPARFELPMLPGSEKTVVVNVIYNSVSGEAQPCRLVASLGDWSILSSGEAEYYKAGTQPSSASSWLT